jgi:hypothetical protein
MSLPALYTIAAEYRQQAAQLAELDLDEQTLTDTLESLQWPVEEKAKAVSAVIGNMEAAADLVKAFAKRKAEEAAAIQHRADRLRAYLLTNMQACGISEIKANDGSLTLRIRKNPPKVVIDDAGAIPGELYVYPDPPAPYPDKTAIKERIKAGEEVPGAHLECGERLEIK